MKKQKSDKIKVLIADDHAILLQGLKQILSETADMAVVAEARDGHEVLEKVRQIDVDIVVMDIAMPGKTGWDVLIQLKSERFRLPVIILSVSPEDEFAVATLKAGAAGYLSKASAPEQLVEAIRRVARGGKFVSPSLAERLVFELGPDAGKPRHEILSPREFQIMCMIASGKSVTDIADELSLSIPTISTHRARLLEKMQMTGNAQLTRYAIKNHLVD